MKSVSSLAYRRPVFITNLRATFRLTRCFTFLSTKIFPTNPPIKIKVQMECEKQELEKALAEQPRSPTSAQGENDDGDKLHSKEADAQLLENEEKKYWRVKMPMEEVIKELGWTEEKLQAKLALGIRERDIRAKAYWKKKRQKMKRKRQEIAETRAAADQEKSNETEVNRKKPASNEESEDAKLIRSDEQILKNNARNRWRGISAEEIPDFQAPSVVFDFGFNGLLTHKERASVCTQMCALWGFVKRIEKPLTPHIVSFSSDIGAHMKQTDNSVNWKFLKHEDSLIEVFDKSKIVYLTPDTKRELDVLEPDKVYVIGGLADHNRLKGITAEKAKELGLMTARLPIESFLGYSPGNSLLIHHVYMILNYYFESKDWKQAMEKVIPKRKGFSGQKTARELKQKVVNVGNSDSSSVDILAAAIANDAVSNSNSEDQTESKEPKTTI